MRRTGLCLLALLAMLTLSGCTRYSWINSKYDQKMSVSRDRLLILPAEGHRLPQALRPVVARELTRQLVVTFGSQGVNVAPVSAQLLKAGFGNLSWQVGRVGYLRGVLRKKANLDSNRWEWMREMGPVAKRFVTWVKFALRKAGAAVPVDLQLRYLVAAHVERLKLSADGKRIHLRVEASVFDTLEARVVAGHWWALKIDNNPVKLEAALKDAGARLRAAFNPLFAR